MATETQEQPEYSYDRLAYAHWWERPVIRWCLWWHGEGAAHQPDYYACHGCGKLVSHKGIQHGGCQCGRGQRKLSPVSLTLKQKAQIVCLPWTVVH